MNSTNMTTSCMLTSPARLAFVASLLLLTTIAQLTAEHITPEPSNSPVLLSRQTATSIPNSISAAPSVSVFQDLDFTSIRDFEPFSPLPRFEGFSQLPRFGGFSPLPRFGGFSPLPPFKRFSPLPSFEQFSPPPAFERFSPLPPFSPPPAFERFSPLPPFERFSPLPPFSPPPPFERFSPLPPFERFSPLPPFVPFSPLPSFPVFGPPRVTSFSRLPDFRDDNLDMQRSSTFVGINLEYFVSVELQAEGGSPDLRTITSVFDYTPFRSFENFNDNEFSTRQELRTGGINEMKAVSVDQQRSIDDCPVKFCGTRVEVWSRDRARRSIIDRAINRLTRRRGFSDYYATDKSLFLVNRISRSNRWSVGIPYRNSPRHNTDN